MNKFICPNCYDQHDVNSCLMSCSKTDCPNEVKRDALGYIDMGFYEKCKKCNIIKDYLCPSIEKVIPFSCIYAKGLIVSVVEYDNFVENHRNI